MVQYCSFLSIFSFYRLYSFILFPPQACSVLWNAFFIFVFFVQNLMYSINFSMRFFHSLRVVSPRKDEYLACRQPINDIIRSYPETKILLLYDSRTAGILRWDRHLVREYWGQVLKETEGNMDRVEETLIQQGFTHII